MSALKSLDRDVSPPAPSKRLRPTTPGSDADNQKENKPLSSTNIDQPSPSLAAVEAGQAHVEDHLRYFSRHLSAVSRPAEPRFPRLPFTDFEDMYSSNQHAYGHHFVVHQHDHPVSGVHYDLRLQFSETSSVSWSIPYGLPGNPNSIRPHRMAIETRVHTLWNNLIESASHSTGSLLIWDTGVYEVVSKDTQTQHEDTTEDEPSENEATARTSVESDYMRHENEKLIAAFRKRHIKLRLHGTRLPAGYTVSLRLPLANDRSKQPRTPKPKRKRTHSATPMQAVKSAEGSSETEADDKNETHVPLQSWQSKVEDDEAAAIASEVEDEDELIRLSNAYPGAHNTLGSIHQRHWFLTLDRTASGFRKVRTGADRGQWQGPWEAFFVRGRDVERSVVTGRNADEVMQDEGVERFVGRKMWRPIIE